MTTISPILTMKENITNLPSVSLPKKTTMEHYHHYHHHHLSIIAKYLPPSPTTPPDYLSLTLTCRKSIFVGAGPRLLTGAPGPIPPTFVEVPSVASKRIRSLSLIAVNSRWDIRAVDKKSSKELCSRTETSLTRRSSALLPPRKAEVDDDDGWLAGWCCCWCCCCLRSKARPTPSFLGGRPVAPPFFMNDDDEGL